MGNFNEREAFQVGICLRRRRDDSSLIDGISSFQFDKLIFRIVRINRTLGTLRKFR